MFSTEADSILGMWAATRSAIVHMGMVPYNILSCQYRAIVVLSRHNVMTPPYGARILMGTGHHDPDVEAGEILMAVSPVCSKCNLYVARNGYTCSQLICECVQGKRRKTTEELVKGRELARARRVITQFLKSA